MQIKFLKPNINSSDIQRMVKSVKSEWLVPGKYVKEFENKLGAYVGGKATMTNSCTSALHTALILAGVEEGDEVITTPLSWVATANVILYQKAKPVFVDVEPDTGLIDIDKIERVITPITKAIIVVHLYGQMVNMIKLIILANKYGIKIIEDAAHALEAKRDGYRPGQLGLACFSFHAAKNLTCGNGGAIISDNPERCVAIRRHGVTNVGSQRIMTELGYKYEPTDFQAAMLIGQLDRIDKSHKQRQVVFKRYLEGFYGKVKFPEMYGEHAGHMFIIWVDPNKRDLIREQLLKKGIETSIHYNAITLEPYYKKLGFKKGSFPIAERLGASTITLPTYPMSKTKQEYIISEVISCVSH